MNILSVYAHPRSESFTRALLDACLDGAREAGHTIQMVDLYRERFDPSFCEQDYAQFGADGRMPADVEAYQQKIRQAEALVFAFPVWWWSMPAILKGWFDRIFSFGFAYGDAEDGSTGLLADRPVVLLTPGLTSATTVAKYGYESAFRQTTLVGLFAYCGLTDVRWHLFSGVGSEDARREHLRSARAAGARI